MKQFDTKPTKRNLSLIIAMFMLLSFLGLSQKTSAQCTAKFGYKTSGTTVSFYDSSSSKGTYKVKWTFGDAGTSDNKTPTHTYASKDSTYKVCLTIIDSANKCSTYTCTYVTVKKPSCSASFTYSVSGSKVTFTNTSSTAYGFTSSWEFGDGTTSKDKTPSHTYSKDSTYKVCLKVTDSTAKCSETYCASITISTKSSCNADFSYSVSGKKVTFTNNSTAKNSFKSTWSFGDGYASNDKTPSHSYSKDSTFHVCLRIIDSAAACTSTVCKDIAVKSSYKIGGRVSADSNLAYPGKAWLIVYNATDSSLSAVKDQKLMKDSIGAYYLFTDVAPGTYYTKAALDSTCKVYKNYLPTYHEKATRWKYSTKIVLSTADITNANISLEKGTNKGGKGFIKGKLSAGANKVGDPMPNLEVALYDVFYNPIAYTYSDVNGVYQFNNIDYGSYIVYVEVLGVYTYPSLVNLTETNQGQNNVDFAINATQVRAVSGIVSSKTSTDNINMYPNPVRNVLNVNVSTQYLQEAHIAIYDINGKMVSQNSTQLAPGTQTLQVNTTGLGNGMYFMKIQLTHDNTFIQSPFVKAE